MTAARVNLFDLCQPKQWPVLSATEMSESGYPVFGANGQIGFSDTYTHENPVLLIGCRGSCGTLHITPPLAYANGNAMALDALDTSRVSLRFLLHFLRWRGFQDVVSGSSQPQITQTTLRRIEIPLPPLAEQKRIAAVLDKADDLRAKRRHALATLDTLLQSVFLDMFGDNRAGNTSGAKMMKLDDALECIIDYRGKTPTKTTSGVPLVTAKIVKGGRIAPATEFIAEADYVAWMRRGLPKIGDVVFTTEAPLGEVARIDNAGVALAQRLVLLRGKAELLDNGYLQQVLQLPRTRHQLLQRSTGSTVVGIRQKELRKVEIPVPPIVQQRRFTLTAVGIERLRDIERVAISQFDALFASLQSAAFAGTLFDGTYAKAIAGGNIRARVAAV